MNESTGGHRLADNYQTTTMIKNTFILFVFTMTSAINCMNKDSQVSNDAQFYMCEYTIDWDNPLKSNQWIDDKQGAMDAKLSFENPKLNNRNTDSLYQTTAQYLFALGGGSIFVTAEKCVALIQKDSLIIYYDPIIHTGEVGEAATSRICMEIDKIKYPNYKSMKIKYVQTSLE
jgi:hypothetical protein